MEFHQFLKERNLGDDVLPVINLDFNDAGYVRQISHAKRFLELFTMDAEFKEEIQKGNAEVIAAHSLDVSLDDMRYLYDNEKALEFKDKFMEMPQTARRYKGFMLEKFFFRERLLQEGCAPSEPIFRKWRHRQVNRCWGELGSRNQSIVHTPLMFELAKGCSVGCEFCGVSAEKLSKVFFYTPENAALWTDVLNKCREIIGESAGTGTCYLATEPLDNPDYEKFALDYYPVFGKLPQLTTAVADRDVERTKALLKSSHALYPTIHRFSILSLEKLKTILGAFSPEELLCVELLPQFKEAPASNFAGVGRAFNNREVLKKDEPSFGETISCVTGFVVNMAEKTIRLTTPCGASEKRPNGEIVLARETFANTRDFEEKINGLIKKYMTGHIPSDLPLTLQPYFTHHADQEGFVVSCSGDEFKVSFKDNAGEPAVLKEITPLLIKGKMTARELATELYERKELDPSLVYNKLNVLYNAGILVEYPDRETPA